MSEPGPLLGVGRALLDSVRGARWGSEQKDPCLCGVALSPKVRAAGTCSPLRQCNERVAVESLISLSFSLYLYPYLSLRAFMTLSLVYFAVSMWGFVFVYSAWHLVHPFSLRIHHLSSTLSHFLSEYCLGIVPQFSSRSLVTCMLKSFNPSSLFSYLKHF